MTLGIGVDLVDTARIERALERNEMRFVQKILSSEELIEFESCSRRVNFVAKRFAVKEAVAKALGTGFAQGVSWTDISLEHDDLGCPAVSLAGGAAKRLAAMGGQGVLVSISDDAGLVIAYAHAV